jgi:thiosulfate/3-mercaptopyruvate sulfurtransferase
MNIMKSLLIALALVIGSIAHASGLEPVIDSFRLVSLLEAQLVKVLEIRSDEKTYLKNHIPGSVYIPYDEFRGPKANPGKLPNPTQLANSLGARGINTTDSLVIVHDGVTTTDFGAAARVYWTLKSFGFESLAILNGGFRGYQKDGFDLFSGLTTVKPVAPELVFGSRWYADTAEVEKQILMQGNAKLLDARLDAFYAGEAWHDAATRPGILPGAVQFPFDVLFDKNSPLLKDTKEVKSIVAAQQLDQSSTISYCNTGHLAATTWFVLSEVAKVNDVKLYAESIVEWSALGKPMENVPTLAQFTILQTKRWFGGLVN